MRSFGTKMSSSEKQLGPCWFPCTGPMSLINNVKSIKCQTKTDLCFPIYKLCCPPLHRYWLRCVKVVIRMRYASWKRTVSILLLCSHVMITLWCIPISLHPWRLNCVTDVTFCGARPRDAGVSDVRPLPAREPTHKLLPAHRNHKRVGASKALVAA